MRYVAGVLALLLAAGASAQQVEFKGVPMGASVSELRNGMGEWFSFSCSGDEAAEVSCTIDGFTYANQKVRKAVATFQQDKLQTVLLMIEPDAFDGTVAALRAKYGAPQSDKKSTAKNAFGASFAQRDVMWSVKDGGAIFAALRASKVDEATIYLASRQAVLAAGRDAAKKPPAKKDI